jgi:nitrite reductase (NADH) small subunit
VELTMGDVTIGPLSAIPPGEGRSFVADGEKIAVFCTRGGKVFAVQAECPHRGGPLADGLLGGTTLICPLHGWKFDLTTGNPLMGDCAIKMFPVRVDETGKIVVTVDGQEAR